MIDERPLPPKKMGYGVSDFIFPSAILENKVFGDFQAALLNEPIRDLCNSPPASETTASRIRLPPITTYH